jgi:hypothetical protein
MAGFVILAVLLLAAVWLLVYIRRNPPMPAKQPFEAAPGESVVGSPRKPPDPTAYADLRAGDGAGFGG